MTCGSTFPRDSGPACAQGVHLRRALGAAGEHPENIPVYLRENTAAPMRSEDVLWSEEKTMRTSPSC